MNQMKALTAPMFARDGLIMSLGWLKPVTRRFGLRIVKMNIPDRKSPDFYPIALGVMKATLETILFNIDEVSKSDALMKEFHILKLERAVVMARENLDKLRK